MTRLVGILIIFLVCTPVWAKKKNTGWIFTPSVGVNKLSLDTFYNTVYRAPFKGAVQITTDLAEDVEGQNQYPTEEFFFENNLEQKPIDVEAGLEMRRSFGLANDFFIGISAWETNSTAKTIRVTFPLQGQPDNRADYSRDGKLTYTQYYVGVRHYLTPRTRKFNAYINLSLNEIYDVDYEERNVFSFVSGAPKGFKRIFIFQSQATGLLMLQFGGGAEYRFAERFSIGLEGAYAIHIKDGPLKGVRINDDTNNGDRLEVPPNVLDVLNPQLQVGALSADGQTHNKVNLRFDGWHALLKFNIQFY